jgi:cytoskeleton protein RodZ
MTDQEIHGDDAPATATDALPLSFGARLAAAREKEGLSVGEMAGRLRLHVNQVRALESENFAQLPEPAYVRGFVRSYARSLGLDPAPLVEDLNTKLAPPAGSVVEGIARARDYSPVRAAAQERASRSLVLGLSVLALVALGALGWYATRQSRPEPAPAAATPAQAPAQSAAPAAPATEPVVEPAPAPSQPLHEVASMLAVTFSGPSWVEVTDAGGTVLVSRMANAGEVLKPTGTAPLSVVIGDASKASVTVRGEPFNLEAATRANIARFTVK